MFFFSKESPFFQTNLKTLTKNLTVYKKKTKGLHGNRMTNNAFLFYVKSTSTEKKKKKKKKKQKEQEAGSNESDDSD